MSIKQLSLRTVMDDPRNGLGDDYDPDSIYYVIGRGQAGQQKYHGCEVVAECAGAAGEDMIMVKRKKNEQGV